MGNDKEKEFVRQSDRATLRKLANTTQDAIDSVHGVEAAASITRGSKSMFSVYANPNEQQYIGIDQAIDLMIAGKNIVFLDMLAQQFNYTLIKNMDPANTSQWGKEFIDLTKNTGSALNKISIALEDDGDISSDEIKALKIRKEIARTMQALVNIDRHLQQVEDEAENKR